MTEDDFVDTYLPNLPNVDVLIEKWKELPVNGDFFLEKESVDELIRTENLVKFGLEGFEGVVKELAPGNRTLWFTASVGLLIWD